MERHILSNDELTINQPSQVASNSEDASPQISSGVLFAVIGTFLFALKSIFIKLAFSSGANAEQLLFVRLILSAPFYLAVLIWLRHRNKHAERSDDHRTTFAAAAGLGFFGYYLASLLDMKGLEHISAQLERLTLFTYPTMIAILAAIFLGERITKRIVTAIVLCYIGIGLMYFEESKLSLEGSTALGVWLVLGSALSYSIYVTVSKRMIQKVGSLAFTCWAMLGSSLFIFVHFLLRGELNGLFQSSTLWLYGTALAFISTVIPSFLISESIARIGTTRTSIIGTIGPVLTMLLAIWLLAEPTSLQHFAGMIVVIAGVSLVSKSKSKSTPVSPESSKQSS